jgi:hypothetical protein
LIIHTHTRYIPDFSALLFLSLFRGRENPT